MKTVIFVILLASVCGCTNTPVQSDTLDAATEQKIRNLIEQLASKNTPPSGGDVFGLKRPKNWDQKAQDTVDNAREKLGAYGKLAIPILLENLDDDRYSMTLSYSVEINHSVGEICGFIITGKISTRVGGYKSRTGTDGAGHNCPDYFYAVYKDDLKQWWQENKDKSVLQMKVDALQWRIEEEKKIGFPDEESKKYYYYDLVHILNEIKAGSGQ